jgi:hypothetical protein
MESLYGKQSAVCPLSKSNTRRQMRPSADVISVDFHGLFAIS